MLQIEYNGSFLKLAKGSAIEIEKNSPLFMLDTVLAEYSMPITILYDQANVELLGDVFFDHGIKAKIKLQVNIFDAGTFKTAAVLIIDKNIFVHQVHGRGNVQGYLLTGISDFFATIKNKKLSSLMLGGIRRFNFTSWDPFDSSDGWWQHFHQSWDNSLDFIMVPHRNDGWLDHPGYDGWINQMGYGYLGGLPQFEPGKVEALTWPVLFPRLKYVLQQLFIENGWSIDFSGINDTNWERLFLYNTKPIQTTQTTDGLTPFPINIINFQISDFISPEILCTEFLLAICNRYGWAPLCDSDTKTCRLLALKEASKGAVKDFTAYAAGTTNTDFSGDVRVFDFTNQLPANDPYPTAPDFTNFVRQAPVLSLNLLPDPTIDFDTSLFFVFNENAWYYVNIDDAGTRYWEKKYDNIFDQKNEGATDTFDTMCSTLPMQKALYRETITGDKWYGYFPISKQPRNKQWGLRTLYYHGMAQEITESGAAGPMLYPLCSSIAVIPVGTIVAPWSNVFEHTAPDGTAYGLIDYWWKKWLQLLKVSNIVEMVLNLPIYELAQLQWDDIINIKNQPYLLKKYIQPHPYKGSITATLHPLLLDAADQALSTSAGIYYVKLFRVNPYPATNAYFDNLQYCSLVARVFSDPGCTVLVAPPAPIVINMVFTAIPRATAVPVYGGPEQHTISRAENEIYSDAMYEASPAGTMDMYDYYFTMLDGVGYVKIN